ncbi:C4-dicarboxylate transporter DcuC [Parasutterella sp.]|uniref:C4-dicarboxylate transporter DcuC n=1 Tax=Parasutterella sp. TaxID=2049037 RepID=UPI003AB3CE20
MTFNFLGPGLTVNVEAKVKEQIILDSSDLIYKNYEARLVLALSGLVMAFIGQVVVGTNGGVSAAVDAFVKQLVNGGLVPTIVTVMGFGYVMTFTKCSDHLVNLLVKPLARVPVIVIPGAVIITWLLNIVLPSAAGIAAAVGVLLIPALIALKVRPVMAAAAVFIGTWGSVVSPGLMFNPQIADIAFKAKEIPAPDAMIVIMQEALPCAIGALVAAICLTIICIVLKEGVGSTEIVKELPDGEEIQKNFKVNPIKAIIPIIPLALLVLASKQVGVLPTKAFSVPVCMLIGTAIGLIVALFSKQKIGEASKKFCRGAGDGFCDVVILIAAAAMFASGMKAIGLTGALVDAMKGSQSVAMFAAAAGPFVMAAISGSGNAAALAFNQAITPNAADFGLTIVQLGAVAQIAAGLGRSMSPVAGGVIILAGIAGVNPMEVVKRTAIPAIVALIVVTLLMFAMS